MAARFSKSGNPNPLAEKIHGSSESAAQKSDIVWSGDSWLCEKQLKHYSSFSRNQTNISVFSFVRVLGDDKKAFIGYVEDLFEDAMGDKMVRMRPFLFGEDIKALVPKLNPQIREVFITSTELEISAKYIEGPAEILNPRHFNRDPFLTLKCFVCHREFKNNTVKPFSLGKLRGYSTQPIISSLESRAPNPSNGKRKATAEARPIILALECIPPVSKQTTKGKLVKKGDVESIVPPVSQTLSKDNQNDYVEVLSLDSGLRGCWFRCKILRSTKKHLMVQYCDVNVVDEPDKVEEWVIKSRPANPDKLGKRCEGRLTVRPWPQWDSSDMKFESGVAVDSWLFGGWWEGVITGYDTSSNDNLQVYFPGENKFRIVGKENVRISKDWVNNEWVDVKRKTDMLSFINSYLMKVTFPPLNNSPPVLANGQVRDPVRVGGSGGDKHLEQLLKIKEKEDWTPRGSGNAAKGKMGKTVCQGEHGRMA